MLQSKIVFFNNVAKKLLDNIATTNSMDIQTEYPYVKNSLKNIILEQGLECIINEYQELNALGKLHGETIEHRCEEFLTYFDDFQNIAFFFKKYTVLHERIINELDLYLCYIEEIYNYFQKDKLFIHEHFVGKFDDISNIELSMGDKHQDKSVAIVMFKSGDKLIFKPRDGETDLLFKEITNLVNKDVANKIETTLVLSRENYSWHEFIQHSHCHSVQDVETFYEKCGIALSIFYILGTSDLHFENMISKGNNPYFIDMETIFTGQRSDRYKAVGNKDIADSVLATSLLPITDGDDGLDVNVSALFTETTPSKKMQTYEIINHPTLDFVFRKVNYSFSPEKNLVVLNGKLENSAKYANNLIVGFSTGCKSILQNKKDFTDLLNKYTYKNNKFRQVVRPTYIYGKFLDSVKHPKVMQSKQAYNAVFDILVQNFIPSESGYLRVEKEVEDLKNGNVPYFYGTFNTRHLYSSDKIICENYFIAPPSEQVFNKIQSFSEVDIDYQIRFIRMSIATILNPEDNLNVLCEGSKNRINRNSIVSNLQDYFLNLERNTVYINDVGATMYGISLLDGNKFKLKRVGFDFYHSIGTILAMAYYGNKYDETFLALSEKYTLTLNEDFERLTQEREDAPVNYSVYNGISGLLFLNISLYQLTKNIDYLQHTKKIINYINNFESIKKMENEFFNGLSGICLLLSNLYKLNIDYEVNNLIQQFMKIVSQRDFNVTDIENSSLAHGELGYLVGKIAINRVLHDPKVDLILKNKVFEILSNTEQNLKKYGWCNGHSGLITILAFVAKDLKQNDSLYHKIIEYFQSFIVLVVDDFEDISLCHGSYGFLDALLTVNRFIDVNSKISSVISQLYINNLRNFRFVKDSDADFESFMLGSGGVAYTYLRYLHNDLPSIMNLEI